MIQSIYAGVSGLQSFQTGIDVLANNVSNVNTVGFKGSRVEFSNLFEKTMGNGIADVPTQVGLGVRVSATALDLKTGSYSQTDRSTDLSIQGNDGWFGLLNGDDLLFSRAGDFGYDAFLPEGQTDVNASSSNLVNPGGLFVAGTPGNNFVYDPAYAYSDGTLGAYVLTDSLSNLALTGADAQGSLEFPTRFAYPPQATMTASFSGNIGIENVAQSISSEVISPSGERNNLTLVFQQVVPQAAIGTQWNITATIASADYDSFSGTGTLYDTQTGTANFSDTGSILDFQLPSLDNNGAPVTTDLGQGFDGLISSAGASVSSTATQDGTVGGEIDGYGFQQNGDIVASFSNGQSSLIGKVAIYHFQNDHGLEPVSGNVFKTSANSGNPIFYAQENGKISSSSLETSNVTLETALTELIVMQRSYDATAKTISTADQMLQNALSM